MEALLLLLLLTLLLLRPRPLNNISFKLFVMMYYSCVTVM